MNSPSTPLWWALPTVLPHAACLAVATKPAILYNPLFIYGNSGLGKTHLLYAVSKEVHKSFPQMSTVYIKGEGLHK